MWCRCCSFLSRRRTEAERSSHKHVDVAKRNAVSFPERLFSLFFVVTSEGCHVSISVALLLPTQNAFHHRWAEHVVILWSKLSRSVFISMINVRVVITQNNGGLDTMVIISHEEGYCRQAEKRSVVRSEDAFAPNCAARQPMKLLILMILFRCQTQIQNFRSMSAFSPLTEGTM